MDTIIIKIYGPRKFSVEHKSWFLPELNSRQFHELSDTEKKSRRPYLRRFVFRPPRRNCYRPSIQIFETLTPNRDEVRYTLEIKFSVPKLLYRNSLQEVAGSDLVSLVHTLNKSLLNFGIVLKDGAIENARLSTVHFCKNVLLPRDIRMQTLIDELARVDISKVVDIDTKEFKSGGSVLNIFSGTVEQVFYDKVSDALRPKVKRKDKGYINPERAIVERFQLHNREVFRYEYRLKKTQTVAREINIALGREPKTFVALKDIFIPDFCKTTILKSWRGLIQRPANQLALLGPTNEESLLWHILSEARKRGGAHSMNHGLVSYGLTRAIRDHGAKELRRV